jgi:hypothetical protein
MDREASMVVNAYNSRYLGDGRLSRRKVQDCIGKTN